MFLSHHCLEKVAKNRLKKPRVNFRVNYYTGSGQDNYLLFLSIMYLVPQFWIDEQVSRIVAMCGIGGQVTCRASRRVVEFEASATPIVGYIPQNSLPKHESKGGNSLLWTDP